MATWIKAGFWEKLCKPCKGYKGWLNLDELIKSFIPPPPEPTYRVYTALLTQSGGDNSINITSESAVDLIIGTSYTITDIFTPNQGGDFTNVGAPNNNIGTSFVATGTTPNSWGKTQLTYNTGAPIVTVLENTIGNIWFTYNYVGDYRINSDSLFTENKTYITVNGQSRNMDGNPAFIYSGYFGAINNIGLQTLISDVPYPTFSNDALLNTPIEIRVYN